MSVNDGGHTTELINHFIGQQIQALGQTDCRHRVNQKGSVIKWLCRCSYWLVLYMPVKFEQEIISIACSLKYASGEIFGALLLVVLIQGMFWLNLRTSRKELHSLFPIYHFLDSHQIHVIKHHLLKLVIRSDSSAIFFCHGLWRTTTKIFISFVDLPLCYYHQRCPCCKLLP